MGRIPPETIEQILQASDIVDVIGSYFPLQRSGSTFRCNCPFHAEKTPSFHVFPSSQRYKCFGCGEGGSAINFLMEYENLPFVDAVRKLADRTGIPIIEEAHDPESDRKRRKITRIKELNNKAARFFHHQLLRSPDAQHARDYLKSRGFNKALAEKWIIGWAPRDSRPFLEMARKEKFTGREIVQAGLGGLRDAENPRSGLWVKFYDQLTFPIHNDYGDVVGFSARILREDDKRGKYINTSDTPLFNKSKLLFGLDKARRPIGKERFALICEGQVDAIVLHESGFENTVAPLGTAFTEDHARMIKRYTKDHVVLCYDGDNAGLLAADKAFKQLTAQGLPVKLMHLPEGDDPDSFIKREGAESFRKLMDSAKEYFDAKLEKELPQIDLSSATDKAELLKKLAESVSVMSDEILRDATIQNIATRLRIGADDFRQAVVKAKQEQNRFHRRDPDEPVRKEIEPTPIDHSVAYLCHLALHSEEAAEFLREQEESMGECLREILGSQLLLDILTKRPNPENNASRQTYLMTLPEEDRLALEQSFSDTVPDEPASAAADTVAMLSARFYQMKEKALRSRLNDPTIGPEETLEAVAEAQRLRSILKDLRERF